jgi:hypothetical protein
MPSVAVAILFILVASGCAGSIGKMPQATQSETHLDRANFRVIKASARGEDQGFYLLGFIPILMPSISDATDRLMQGISAEGRAVSLTNVTQERQTLYLVLFSLPKIVVRADVIEFLADQPTSK